MKTFLPTVVIVLSATACFADKDTDISPVLAKPGSVILNDSFDSAKLSRDWRGVKGDWKIVDGTLVGSELESDNHAAVLNCQKQNKDSVVRLSFKLDGATKGFNLSLNHAKGHLFRVVVAPTGLTVRTDKDKKDATIKSELIGQAKGKFQQGKWYTLQVEMVGDRVVAMTDNGLKVTGQHARLDTSKPNYRLVMRDETLSIDDFKVWSVK